MTFRWTAVFVFTSLYLELASSIPVHRRSTLEAAGNQDPCDAQERSDSIQRWPGGIIPYILDERLTANTKRELMTIIHRWENSSCVAFIPRTEQQDYAQFEPGESCCSFTGRVGGGMQMVYIQDNSPDSRSLDDTIQALIGIPRQLRSSSFFQENLSHSQPERHDNTPTGHDTCSEMCGGCTELDPEHSRTGEISSPLHPNRYPDNTDCVWKLIAPAGHAIRITFDYLDVEADPNCDYDYVHVFTLNPNGVTLGSQRLCGMDLPEAIVTEVNAGVVVVRFHSDESYAGNGFLFSYALEARNTSDLCAINNGSCDHTCLEDAHGQRTACACREGYSLAEDGHNCTARNTSDLCAINNGGCDHTCLEDAHGQRTACACREGYSLAEDGHNCTDINECDQRRGNCQQRCNNTEGSFQCFCRQGFSLNPDIKTCRPCGSHHNKTSGTIIPLGYPSPYSLHQNCKWTIEAHPNHHLKITLSNVDIARSEKCTTDFLKLGHGHFPHQRKLCGYYLKITYVTDQSTYVRFHTSDINRIYTGFNLSYSQIPTENLTFLDREYVLVDGEYIRYKKRLWI